MIYERTAAEIWVSARASNDLQSFPVRGEFSHNPVPARSTLAGWKIGSRYI